MNTFRWHFWIDRGGTFTDVIGRAPDGTLHSRKLLSDNPESYRDAAAEGIRRVLAEHGGGVVDEIRMGTTVATNALLERRGARTGVVFTRGFGDTLLIGEQDRPRLFDLHIRKPGLLYEVAAEVDERLDADGKVLTAPDLEALEPTLRDWHEAGIESVAVCLLHAWLNPAHEQAVAARARAIGFTHVYTSAEVSPLMKYIARAGTTVADAYLSPVLLRYVTAFREELETAGVRCDRVLFMQSHGGLVSAERFRGRDAILSGPAGGVVGMREAGRQAGHDRLIGFDMGGTSTDVSLCAGEPDIVEDTEVGGVHIRAPMIRIHTIAAGGGSVLSYRQGRFTVGPESAGANPGPLCYGRGGPLALTDANVMLGRIQPRHFPRVFGADGRQPLDAGAVRDAFGQLAKTVADDSGRAYSAEQTAEGFLHVAVDNMANAIRHVSVERGINPADYTLCCFGGAGGQHACRVAERLGIRRVLLDPLAGVLSARGMGAASLRAYRQRSLNRPLSGLAGNELDSLIAELARESTAELKAQGAADIRIRAILNLKASGTDTLLPVNADREPVMRAAFVTAYRDRFGFAPDPAALRVDSLRVEAEATHTLPGTGAAPSTPGERRSTDQSSRDTDTQAAATTTRWWLDNAWQQVPVYRRESLRSGATLHGPALITEANSTTALEPGWVATVNEHRQLLLMHLPEECVKPDTAPVEKTETGPDPVLLEIINNHFVYIADEMGTVLRSTARSVNIRERLDFSCALFTAAGDLIANAPHVPVHLGSMDDSVKAALRERAAELNAGSVILTNAPYNGGTHLPDITAISALHNDDGELAFLVASRAHHADVGGLTPGSMPPFSSTIHEEGVLFDNFVAVSDGQLRESELRETLAAGPWPARNPEQNLADFRAQIAANERGKQLLRAMLAHYGQARVSAYTRHVRDNAEEAVRKVIARLGEGRFRYTLDNGQCICVQIRIDQRAREAVIDFTGTSAAQANNFNAPKAVCQAAVMYVFRTLVDSEIPLNAGCRKPLRLIIPEGCFLNPRYPAAVVGGNVETSQCVTDALYGALGVVAGSQGTMNNLSFGNDQYQYYETIGGGAGAGPGFAGADAVQTHMTNTRITDVEVLESGYPVLLREFSVRRGSGGAGKFPGGNGIVRKIEFRAALSAAVLSGNRSAAPFGLSGGKPGKTGRNAVKRSDGRIEEHGGVLAVDMAAGDVLIIETPGGGGAGWPPAK